MTRKITDLEGRLDAAYDRAYKPKLDQIARYRMVERKGMVPAEIVLVKVVTTETIEFVVWDRNTIAKVHFNGEYFATFREALSRFLKRVEADGARS